MLEPMASFFDSRLEGYEEHQLTCIESAQAFYPFTAELLPAFPRARVLDLGCGTGLELSYYFDRNPAASVTGIDLAPGMLAALRRKFPDKDITLLQGSYFDMPFPEDPFDAALSVESLHHFTQAEKEPLYRRVFQALKPGCAFILTDYFAATDAEERHHRETLMLMKAEQHLPDGEFYHYDTPLTVAHETQALQGAGFTTVEELGHWGATHTLRAVREDA